MALPTLTNAESAVLAGASRQSITNAAARLKPYLTQARWLGTNNRYATSATSRLRDEATKKILPHAKHIAELVAASAPAHCLDGWSYLGRAMEAHLGGDHDAARHLGYYAELRAAAALLATAGIGIFDKNHIVIGAKGVATQIPRGHGTHQMMWLALEQWAKTSDAVDLVARAVTPAGRPLQEWISNVPGGSSWQPIGTDWLLALGLDLQKLSGDREARNNSSYRPSNIPTSRPYLSADRAARFCLGFWRDLEPTTSRGFDDVDLHVLRASIELAFRSIRGRTERQAPRLFESVIGQAVSATLGTGGYADSISEFLRRVRVPDDALLVRLARGSTNPADAEHHTRVIARAALLLRITTGGVRELLVDAGIPFNEIEFWWSAIAGQRGLWNMPTAGSTPFDNWADISDSLSQVQVWLEDPTATFSYRDFRGACSASLAVLGRVELAGMWGLAS